MIKTVIVVALLVLFTFHIYGAAFASWHLNKSAYFDPWQKYVQYAIIWLVPVLGTAFVVSLLAPEVRHRNPGWIPFLDFVLLSMFVSSTDSAIDASANHEHSATTDAISTDNSSND